MVQWETTLSQDGLTGDPIYPSPGDSIKFTLDTREGGGGWFLNAVVPQDPGALRQEAAWTLAGPDVGGIAPPIWNATAMEILPQGFGPADSGSATLNSVPDTAKIIIGIRVSNVNTLAVTEVEVNIDVLRNGEECPCLDQGCAFSGQPFPIRAGLMPSIQGGDVALASADAMLYKNLVQEPKCRLATCPCLPAHCRAQNSPTAVVDIVRQARAATALQLTQQPYARRR